MDPVFAPSWRRAWQGLNAAGDGLAARDALLARYAEPQRKYHTQQHLAECLRLFDTVHAEAARPAEVEMAIWFHDAVYVLAASDNEARSADWAAEVLHGATVAKDAVARIRELVLATKHVVPPPPGDAQLLVDIDLAILGADEARYKEYERQIRAEYGDVPEAQFRQRRVAVLGTFAARSPLYATPALRRRFEARARRNLEAAIARHASPPQG